MRDGVSTPRVTILSSSAILSALMLCKVFKRPPCNLCLLLYASLSLSNLFAPGEISSLGKALFCAVHLFSLVAFLDVLAFIIELLTLTKSDLHFCLPPLVEVQPERDAGKS